MQMGIECFRVQFPRGMDANEFALKTHPPTKALGMMLSSAAWLGKGKRPTIAVIEPQPAATIQAYIEEDAIKPAAEDEITEETVTTPTEEPIPEPVLSLAAKTTEEPTTAAKEKISEIGATATAVSEEPVSSLAAQPPIAPLPTGTVVTVREPRVEVTGDTVYVTLGERRYRILELAKNTAPGVLHVNVMVMSTNARGETRLHVDKFDLYGARPRSMFASRARTAARSAPAGPHPGRLRACGVVGEETNKKVAYLAAVSRLLEAAGHRGAVVVLAAGKSSLMEAVLDFMPEEQREQYSAMTGPGAVLHGRDGPETQNPRHRRRGRRERAAYALKLLQIRRRAQDRFDRQRPGERQALVTHEYRVEGPVMIFLTTTAVDVDEELLNRCIVLTVNEDRGADAGDPPEAARGADHARVCGRSEERQAHPHAASQRAAPAAAHPRGQRAREQVDLSRLPCTRTRRDHMKFLTLIMRSRCCTSTSARSRPARATAKRWSTSRPRRKTWSWPISLVSEVLTPSLDELQAQTRRCCC
jgi:DNA primase